MAKQGLTWRNAKLPDHTAIFAIGDIHAHDMLLSTMLAAVEERIAALPAGTQAQVIFIGDYIDRGPDAPKTLDLLIDFEARMASKDHVTTTFLAGNHDEIFQRFLEVNGVVDENVGDLPNRDFTHLSTREDGSIYLKGFESWFFRGSGYTTIKSYVPDLDEALIDHENKCFNRDYPNFGTDVIYQLTQEVAKRVPVAHAAFLERIAHNSHIILGDYLFTHAAIDPEKSLAEQGIGEGAKALSQREYLDFLMLRDPFLWRDDLPNCPYVVIHGHTPSAIENVQGNIMADTQKDYRLNIDTCIYAPNGALTCFMHHGDQRTWIAVNKTSPHHIEEYSCV